MNRKNIPWALAGLCFVVGCGGTIHKDPLRVVKNDVAPNASADAKPVEPKEPPPDSLPAKQSPSAPASWGELPNGLKIVSRRNRTTPAVQLRIAVLAGSSTDSEFTGLSSLCSRSVLSSSDSALQGKLEGLGANLDVNVDADRLVYRLSVVSSRAAEALELMTQLVTKPRLVEKEVAATQKQLSEAAAENARSDGQWGLEMVLHRDLFELPTEHHPYASYDATVDDLAKIKPSACKEWHRKYFVPSNMLVAAVGDIEPDKLKTMAQKAFGKMPKGAVPSTSFVDPMPPSGMKITLVDRPGSTQSEIAIGTLGPKECDTTYPAFVVADQVIAGSFTGRLSLDLREGQGLAYRTGSFFTPHANGPSLYYLYAQTQNDSTGKTLSALLDHAQKLANEAPTEAEVETASRFLVGDRAISRGHPRYAATELCEFWVHKQSDDSADELDKVIRKVSAAEARKAFSESIREGHLIIAVAGDASSIGSSLQVFGEVKVVDPTKNFARVKTLPPTAR
jgi:zinc protease